MNWWIVSSDSMLPRRVWWFALLAIVLVAAGLRYPGYDFSLPYIDHVDEPAYNLAARMIIDFGSAKPLGMHGYPPGLITLNYVLMRAFHDPAEPPGTIIWMVRLLSITVSIATVALIGLLTYSVSSPLAGLLAAWLWAVTPILVEHSRFATPDPYVTFFAVLALYFTVAGTLYDRDRWTSWGIFASMGAVVFKYQAIAIVPIVTILPLWRLFTKPHSEHRRIWINWGYNVLVLALFGFWLIAINPTTEAHNSPDWSAAADRFGFPTWTALRTNLDRIITPLFSDVTLIAGLVGLGLLVAWSRLRITVRWVALGAITLNALAWYLAVSLYGDQYFRQFISAGAFLTVLIATGLAGIAAAVWAVLYRWQRKLRLSDTRRSILVGTGVVLAMLGLTIGPLQDSIDNMRDHMLPDRRNDLANYANSSLVSGPYIGTDENHKTFNTSWGGYQGETQFSLYAVASIMERPLEEWRAAGVKYAIVPYYDYTVMQTLDTGQAVLDQVLPLKSYPSSEDYRGPSMVVLALDNMQHGAEGTLGPIALVGYDLDRATVHPGDSVTFRLYWRASGPLDADYRVYNHLVPADSRDIVAQIDGPPHPTTFRGTTDWDDPDETIVSRPFVLTIPEDLQPGTYRLLTGFYHPDTWQRLTASDGTDYLEVTEIAVAEAIVSPQTGPDAAR